jgi:hypothetical protein
MEQLHRTKKEGQRIPQESKIPQPNTHGGVDSVVLGEGDTGGEERGKDSSEEHCVFK